ncbi:MAG: tetratricopeptide repeat protein [Cyclobacteriaceae bacterium]|nr:tetratricopeptide repeat protein [Cyclobacteriaceae bacterium]
MKFNYFLFIVLMTIISACQNEKSLLGDKHFKTGQYNEAIEAYNDFLKLKPKHVKTIYNRGRCYQELSQYDRAMEDFNRVIELDANNENALLSIGQEMYRKEEYNSAAFYGEKVLERDPNNAMAYYLKGRANHKQGFTRDAMHNYNSAINLSPDFGEAYLHRGALKLYLKRNGAACADLRKAVDLKVEGAEDALRKNCR